MLRPVELPGPALPRPAEEWAGREVGSACSQASEESLREMSALLSLEGPAGLKVRVRLKHVGSMVAAARHPEGRLAAG